MESMLQDTEAFIRKSISEEQLAVAVYLDRKQVCLDYASLCEEQGNNELAEKFRVLSHTFEDILSEEEIHIGQFKEMLDLLGVSDHNEDKGEDEAKEDIADFIGESFVSFTKRIKKFL